MISTFNRAKLNSLLYDFYQLAPIRITVFDDQFVELASYPEHIAPVCQIIRADKEGYEHCKNVTEKHVCARQNSAPRTPTAAMRASRRVSRLFTSVTLPSDIFYLVMYLHTIPTKRDGMPLKKNAEITTLT